METSRCIKLNKSKLPLPFLALGYITLLFGIYSLFAQSFAALLVIPGLFISTIYTQKYICLKEMKFVEKTKVLKKTLFSRCNSLKRPEYVVLRPVKLEGRQSVLTISRTENRQLFRFSFVYPANRLRVIYTGNYDSALKKAKLCVEYFAVPFKNRTNNAQMRE